MNPHTLQPQAAALARRLPLAVLIAAALPAFAQQPAADMATVLVAASRSQTKVEQMPLHTTIVSSDEIKSSPAQTLDQLLRNVPGLNFSAVPAALSDPTGHQTKMRGLGNAKVLVLLDGVPIHDPFYLTTQWFKVPLSNIDHIEILRGGNSSLWGNMAVAGVVNIVTKRARTDSGQVQVSAGTQGSWNVAFSRNFALSERAGLNLSGDVYHTDGYQATPAAYLYRFPQKRPTEAENRNLSLTAYARPTDSVQGYVRIGYHEQDQRIGYVYGRNLQKSPDLSAQVERKFADRSLLQANAWAQYVAFDKLNGNTCYYQGGTTCLTSTSAALTPAKVNENVVQFYSQQGTLRYRERGASVLYSTRVNPLLYSVLAGVDYRRLSAEDTELFYNTPLSPAAPQGRFDSSTGGEGTQTFEGVFGQFKFLPLDPLDITLAARVDRYAIGARANRRTLASGAVTGGALPAASKTAFNPSLAGRYEITEALSVRAAAYKAFRAPGFNNLTRSFGTGTSTTIANPDLVPENLRGWEAGLDLRRDAWSAGLTYFLYNISDMIATFTAKAGSAPAQVQLICGGPTLPNCGGSAKYYTNDQDGQAHGVELTAGWRVSSALRFDAYATHTDSYLTRRGAVVTDPLGVQLVGLPKNVAWIGMSWLPAPQWRTHLEARYIGPMLLDTTSSSGIRYGQGGSTAFDASVQYNWSAAVTLFARGSNLLNRRYSESTYSASQPYNQTLSPPRAVQLGLRANF
ncbi:MAG TPA: TonB-dependent receptor [Telluria sp.]|nr:TonB-dependent receptor [Telluria sp.]